MTPARSLAASVAALGFASALTAPQPALAAPESCAGTGNFAAQSGAELARINRLELGGPAPERPQIREDRAPEKADSTAAGVLSDGADTVIPDPEDSDTLSEGIGMTGKGALGYLGVAPSGADGAVAPGARSGLAGDVAELGDDVVGGLTGGVGGGEPVDDSEPATGDDSDGRRGFGTRSDRADKSGAKGWRGDNGSREDDNSRGDNDSRGHDNSRGDDNSREDDERRADDDPQADGDSREDDDSDAGSQTGDDAGTDSSAAEDGVSNKRARGMISDIGIGEIRTAMIARAGIASAAYARMLDGRSGNPAIEKPLLQQAPPTNTKGARRSTPAAKAGPLRLGDGRIGAHAQWDAGMTCGRAAGEAGRADASLASLTLLGNGRGALVRVPGTMTSHGATAIERHNDEVRTVGRSTVTAGRIELAGGKVTVRVLRAPSLEAAMSPTAGGKVSYRPAIVEVSGDGMPTKRLQAAGEYADFALTPGQRAMESAPLTDLGGLGQAGPLPVPNVPGLPSVEAPQPESVTLPAKGIRVRVSLGDVRHAIQGQAIAARASAIKVSLAQASGGSGSPGRGRDGYGDTSGVSLSMAFGVLEAAAVLPEGTTGVAPGGRGGGLPVTGPRLDRVAMTGGGLLLAGIGAVLFGLRRRRSHS